MKIVTFVILGMLVLFGGLIILAVQKKKREGREEEPDYRTFFRIGAIWLPVGTVFMIASMATDFSFGAALPFFSMGLIFFLIGLFNKDKWKKE